MCPHATLFLFHKTMIMNLRQLLTPKHQNCYLCHQYSQQLVCTYCCESLKHSGFGLHSQTIETSADLLRRPIVLKNLETPNYDHLFAIDNYVWPLNQLVLDMKFRHKPVAAKVLSNLFNHFVIPSLLTQNKANESQQATLSMPELLVPVPLANRRYWQREYNQAQLLCDELSLETGLPTKNILQRVRHTKRQTELNKQQRISNVDNAFRCTAKLDCKHIAVVDDVITTGVTMNAVCAAISEINPRLKISVWTMAVTLLD
jgi:ComF family protein